MSPAINTTPNGTSGNPKSLVQSDTRKAIEALLTSASILSKNPAINSILDSLDSIPDLRREIENRKEELKVQESARLSALDDYNGHRDQWKAEEQRLQSKIDGLELALVQSRKQIESLNTIQKNHKTQIEELQKSLKTHNEDIQINQNQILGLTKAIKSERAKTADAVAASEDNAKRFKDADTEKNDLQKQFADLESRNKRNEQELRAAAALTVTLGDDVTVLVGKLEKLDKLWSQTATMISSTFCNDVDFDNPTTRAFWVRLEHQGSWIKSVSVPQSNTPAAKQMRVVVILASLARIFDNQLFQPTYLLNKDSGIRDLLIDQAKDHGAKEAAIRAHLQALLPHKQDAAFTARIKETCDEVMDLVGGLLPATEQADFRARLVTVAEEAAELWLEICRETDAVEPCFDLWHHESCQWNELVFQAQQPVTGRQISLADLQGDRALFAIFPRLWVWYNSRVTPETQGVLFMKSQAQAATEEMEKQLPSPRFERSNSLRQRFSKHRRASSEASSATPAVQQQPFLDKSGSGK